MTGQEGCTHLPHCTQPLLQACHFMPALLVVADHYLHSTVHLKHDLPLPHFLPTHAISTCAVPRVLAAPPTTLPLPSILHLGGLQQAHEGGGVARGSSPHHTMTILNGTHTRCPAQCRWPSSTTLPVIPSGH